MAGDVNLGEHLERFVSLLVESGRYQSRSEVLREGVGLVEEREKRLTTLDTAITRGIADADTGKTKPAGVVAARLTAKYEGLAKARGG